jgi:glycogen(starch) synthase
MKILIASTLKPINDTRLFEKIALTLVSKRNYKVSIAGFSTSSKTDSTEKVKFYPLFKFKRLSFQRLFAAFKIFRLTLKLKPDVLIITTHELLVVAFFLKIFKNQRVVYDIQENYAYNIRYLQTFPWFVRHLLASYVRCKEFSIAPFIDGFILAEEVYLKQFSFVRNRSIVLPNKHQFVDNEKPWSGMVKVSKPFCFLYTGTISIDYGIWEAIAFIEKLEKFCPQVQLRIIGFTSNVSLQIQILDFVKDKHFIKADIRLTPVPYSEIELAQQSGVILLLPYRFSKAFAGKVPTRLYEGMARSLPMIVEEKLNLHHITTPYNAAIHIDFTSFDPNTLLNELQGLEFYTKNPEKKVLWKYEEEVFLQWFDKMKKI